MHKRGQISAQGFLYILGGIILVMALIVGYGSISKVPSSAGKVEMARLKAALSSDISMIGKEYGSFRKVSYTLPQGIEELCMIDVTKKSSILQSKIIENYPLIRDSLISNVEDNLFFFGEGISAGSERIAELRIDHYPYLNCFRQENGRIDFGIEGTGGAETKLIFDFRTNVRPSAEEETFLQSADETVSLLIPVELGTVLSEVSIQVVEPSSEEIRKGISEAYLFEPIGVDFSPPIQLSMAFNPNLVEGCPTQLVFHQESRETGEVLDTVSSQVDCENSIAYFEIPRFI